MSFDHHTLSIPSSCFSTSLTQNRMLKVIPRRRRSSRCSPKLTCSDILVFFVLCTNILLHRGGLLYSHNGAQSCPCFSHFKKSLSSPSFDCYNTSSSTTNNKRSMHATLASNSAFPTTVWQVYIPNRWRNPRAAVAVAEAALVAVAEEAAVVAAAAAAAAATVAMTGPTSQSY